MATYPWFPLYVGDYIRDTSHLSTEQHGAYLLLLCHQWASGRLPDDDQQLARIARLSLPVWRRHRRVVLAFFQASTGQWFSPRLERERGRVEAVTLQRTKAAKSRWNKKTTHAGASFPHMREGMQNDANHSQTREELIQGKIDASASSLSSDSIDEGKIVPLRGRS